MKLTDLVGVTDVNAHDAALHISAWFQPDELVCIASLRAKRGSGKNSMVQILPAREIVDSLRSVEGDDILKGLTMTSDGEMWNTYVCVSHVDHEMTSLSRRGGSNNVKLMPGVWVDLDVKPGSFSSVEEIIEYLMKLPEPTLIVGTGSGGVHAYWKLNEPMEPGQARDVQLQWWSYVNDTAGELSVDKLFNVDRLFRLAGSVRWPKPDENIPAATARVIHHNAAKTYPVEKIIELSQESWDKYSKKILRVQQDDSQRRLEADMVARLSFETDNRWALYAAIARVEETFTELVSWDEVLEPYGWTYLRDDNVGRREFARPGRMEKSATVDWPESPDVMSLLSSAETTGLADLKEAGVVLTKYRVALRLWFNDDETKMIEWTLERSREQQ